MPLATAGLPFYRKKQTLESLVSERPQHLQSVYTIVRENVAAVLVHVAMLEHAYYGPGGSLETEVRRWMPVINQVIRPAKFSDLISHSQLDAIAERIQDPTDKLNVPLDSIKEVYDCVHKAMDSIRLGLAGDIALLEKLREFMHKYCQSFSSAEGERYMETATNYEKQRIDLERAISVNLHNIPLMVDKFEKETLKIHQFDFIMREAGEKTGCARAAVLLMFPAACHHVRNACKGLEMWLEADSNYSEYLQLDIADQSDKRVALARTVHQHVLAAGEHENRIKHVQREIGTCNTELKRLAPKKKALVQEERDLREENHDVLVNLDIKQYRHQEMKMLGHDDTDKFDNLAREIDTLRRRRPAIDRKLTNLQKKQGIVTDKESRRQQLERELEAARAELRAARKAARKAEVEVEKADACLERLREIHRLKVAPDTLKKIFHGMPASPRHAHVHAGKKPKRDKLGAMCQLVASSIESDWVALYHTLPFHPPRGQHIVTDDVDDIRTRFMRHTLEEQAKQSLAKWRRLHTRACLEDLRSALMKMHRPDVLERVETALTPRRPPVALKLHRTVRFPRLPAS